MLKSEQSKSEFAHIEVVTAKNQVRFALEKVVDNDHYDAQG